MWFDVTVVIGVKPGNAPQWSKPFFMEPNVIITVQTQKGLSGRGSAVAILG